MKALEDYLENFAHVKVDIEVMESLMEPENLEVFLRYVLKYSTRGGSNIFPALRHIRETEPLCGKQKTMAGESGKKRCKAGYQGAMTEAPPCYDRTLKTPLLQQSSPSARDEEGGCFLMEDRRIRSIAFENLAKEMLRYLDKSDDVKVGITELQERLEVPVQIGISVQQVAQQERSESGQKMFEVFWQEEEEVCVTSWARWDAQWKGLVELDRRCQDMSREIQEIFKNAIEGKLKVQSRACERLQDQIIEEIKEM